MSERRGIAINGDVIAHYARKANELRQEEFRRVLAAFGRYAVAPFAFGLRRCSSSRGRISTKLHGR